MSIAMTIKAWRDAERLSYEAAGKRLGCSGQAVRSWEINDREPKNDTLRAKVLRILSAWERERANAD